MYNLRGGGLDCRVISIFSVGARESILVYSVDHIEVLLNFEPPAQFHGELWSFKDLFIDFVLIINIGGLSPRN